MTAQIRSELRGFCATDMLAVLCGELLQSWGMRWWWRTWFDIQCETGRSAPLEESSVATSALRRLKVQHLLGISRAVMNIISSSQFNDLKTSQSTHTQKWPGFNCQKRARSATTPQISPSKRGRHPSLKRERKLTSHISNRSASRASLISPASRSISTNKSLRIVAKRKRGSDMLCSGYLPLIIYLGYTKSNPRPSLIRSVVFIKLKKGKTKRRRMEC